ncbi:MAG TPA: TA system VapC family ribonuclease toxin [Candidatus Methylacidiphilales bacterium]|nr:TA system VapC family ribonuclease toxin [Candidatus Methylacidiphilales bacterium]
MTYLFDVNFLIALLDQHHAHYEIAHRWVAAAPQPLRWATCPLTENAFVRITGKQSYPNGFGSASAALDCLRENCSQKNHVFWTDNVSLADAKVWTEPGRISSTHLIDLYLLALAVKNGGKLVSFDRTIPAHLVRGGKDTLLLVQTAVTLRPKKIDFMAYS